MYGVRHHLQQEFPEFLNSISRLKTNDPSFAQLLAKYDDTDKKIYGIERQRRPVPDYYVEDLKKERVNLKDRIYTVLKRSNGH